MNNVGIILRAPDETIQAQAKSHGYPVVISTAPTILFERALLVEPHTFIPWHLIEAGFGFVEKWDCAAPLWRYEALVQQIGTPAERKQTAQITLDERVLVIASELLFVRNTPEAGALLEAWHQERRQGPDARLAFLRALYRVKPRFCALPCSWNGDPVRPPVKRHEAVAPTPKPPRPRPREGELVSVEIAPGRYVRCRPGQEEEVRRRLSNLSKPRKGRR